MYKCCVCPSLAKGSEAGLKSAAVSIQQQIHKYAISDEDDGEIQR